VTFFYAQFDKRTRRLTYVNAGHNPPLLLKNRKEDPDHYWLTAGGPFIGIFDHCDYQQEALQLHSGDLLAAYTDGVTEAQNMVGEEFGEERLKETLATVAHLPADKIREAVLRNVREWCADAPQYDDLTFILMKVK
jgi:sigma-B regulation protein RsbU (phosphoserine phosphatase)